MEHPLGRVSDGASTGDERQTAYDNGGKEGTERKGEEGSPKKRKGRLVS